MTDMGVQRLTASLEKVNPDGVHKLRRYLRPDASFLK